MIPDPRMTRLRPFQVLPPWYRRLLIVLLIGAGLYWSIPV